MNMFELYESHNPKEENFIRGGLHALSIYMVRVTGGVRTGLRTTLRKTMFEIMFIIFRT